MAIFISRTADFLTSSLCSLIPWTANPPSRSPKTKLVSARNQHLKLGLKTLLHAEDSKESPKSIDNPKPRIIHCYTVTGTEKPRSSPPPSLSLSVFFQFFVTDDIIGTESGNYMTFSLSNIEGFKKMVEKSEPESSRSRSRYRNAMMKRIPPPLSILRTETDDLQCQTPWVFKREYTEDGRLIIRTERLQKSCEHLVPHRENGRPVMKFVPAGDVVCCEEFDEPLKKEEEEEEEIESMKFDEKDAEECEDEDADEEDKEAESEDSLEQKWCLVDENERERCGELRKGFMYGGGSGQEPDPFWKGICQLACCFFGPCCIQRKRKETEIDS